MADAQAVLDAGADKVSVNSAALARPELVEELSSVFGAQCVVLAIDASTAPVAAGRPSWPAGAPPTGRDAVRWAAEAVERGAGEILLTSMDRDGTQDGYDLELTRAVSEAVTRAGDRLRRRRRAPSTWSRACAPGADAVLCASIFHYGRYRIARGQGDPGAARAWRSAAERGP